ncbi:aldehyde dehydrogenase [Chamaesiphon polymorphus]|uniref:Aldehyde dehydrogenase n=1 Tax=Chamaesiphon polymorphus CCALA 037 TaxID=2107692 RepID=A0A2T1GHB2_9CYAN|nr:aldehyde dehydrogenase [Chamaesiphon polymorphus]PSB57079.1 aldehyde dehydrogenase family protein [Chamaesiphon polymorphus CCALA 037]
MTQQLVTAPIHVLVKQQRAFFRTEQTQAISFRLEQLAKLKQAIIDRQEAILQAAKADLGRPAFEAYFEIATLSEINLALKNLKTWVKPQRVKSPIDQFPASAWIQPDPLGVVLIIGPWNYPFQLMMSPLVGAIAAGNCALLKPSEHAPHTSRVVAELIAETFDPRYIAVAEGDASVSQQLLAEKFDHIFFTGGTAIGRIVMAAAAKHLTPVTLELGGKSPCIVDSDVHLDRTAKRIAWGKLINAGQTCISPDYLLVQRQIKNDLVDRIQHYIQEFYGKDPSQSPDYGRIIHHRHFDRLIAFLDKGEIIFGGDYNREDRYLAPTLIDGVTWDDPVMQEEIFGPILPILTYDTLEEAIDRVNDRPKPLALYFFSHDRQKQERILQATSSGGVCINDTVMQVGVNTLPFGGVGESGIGSYHGKASFNTFSHFKSILKREFWLDLGWRYAPYTAQKLKQIKSIVTG